MSRCEHDHIDAAVELHKRIPPRRLVGDNVSGPESPFRVAKPVCNHGAHVAVYNVGPLSVIAKETKSPDGHDACSNLGPKGGLTRTDRTDFAIGGFEEVLRCPTPFFPTC